MIPIFFSRVFLELKTIHKNNNDNMHWYLIWFIYMYRIAPSYAAFTTTNANNIHSAVLGASYNYLVRPAELTNVYLEFVIFSINSVVCELAFSLLIMTITCFFILSNT